MQYKQASRILWEIYSSPEVPAEIKERALQLLLRERLPRLGPYQKRSLPQVWWRLASDSELAPKERWTAVRKLIALTRRERRKRCAEVGQQDVPTYG
jgi:hypothetical protein